jgi:hypothetical protein
MTLKAVPIQSKMTKPTLSEVISRLENIFNNCTIRGEDKLQCCLNISELLHLEHTKACR